MEATQLSAAHGAAVGTGNPVVLDPLPGISPDPFFLRDLRFCSIMDTSGRIRFAALTIQKEDPNAIHA
jgi:hypothetical protein